MPKSVKRMPRGAIPSPRWALAAATPFAAKVRRTPIDSSYLMWPSGFSYWGNDEYGDCVTAEEAFAKATPAPYPPYICLPEGLVVHWTKSNGFLNGAYLNVVLETMATTGMSLAGSDGVYPGKLLNGAPLAVNWNSREDLQSAIVQAGPVKLGVAADKFQTHKQGHVTPGSNGWAMFGYPPDLPEDHCVSLCGYGSLAELISLFAGYGVNVKPPKGMPSGLCYALFTWKSIGIVDEQSLLNMTYEAWVREPVTIADSLPTIGKIEVKNDGWFVADIHALYRGPEVREYKDRHNGDNFTKGKSRTMDLKSKCTDPAIQDGDLVQIKVWVQAGDDNTYPGLFVYKSDGPTQRFKIKGTTLDNTLKYRADE